MDGRETEVYPNEDDIVGDPNAHYTEPHSSEFKSPAQFSCNFVCLYVPRLHLVATDSDTEYAEHSCKYLPTLMAGELFECFCVCYPMHSCAAVFVLFSFLLLLP